MSTTSRIVSRSVVTPATLVLFVVSTVTGIMLLVHWKAGLVRFSHEWLSVGFSAIAIWHLVRNWHAFKMYLRQNVAVATLVTTLVLSLAFTGMTGTRGSASPRAVFGALSEATLATAAPALGLTLDQAMTRLADAKMVAKPDRTLSEIAATAGTTAPEVASLLAARDDG